MNELEKGVMGVYQIKNLVNGKIYVGSSVDIRDRWWNHRSRLRNQTHKNSHLQAAWNKYGEDSFEFSILEVVENVDDVLIREQWYLDNWKLDYNVALVASANQLGRPLSEEHKKKISETKRKNRDKFSGKNNYFYGKHHTKETKQKLSNAHSGKILSKEHKKSIGDAQIGEKSHYAKLTWTEVNEIRRLYEEESWTENMLIEKFGMSQGAINKIVRYKTWRLK